jgi:hypothetical protein
LVCYVHDATIGDGVVKGLSMIAMILSVIKTGNEVPFFFSDRR